MTARLFLGLASGAILVILGALWYELRENKP
jgi:predicted outer membrane lipoprotein